MCCFHFYSRKVVWVVWLQFPNNQLNVYATSVTEGEVGAVKHD